MKDLAGEVELTFAQATSIARGMLACAEVERGIHPKEQSTIDAFYFGCCEAEGVAPADLAAIAWDVAEARRLLATLAEREALLHACYVVACADGYCSTLELRFLDDLAGALDVPEPRRRVLFAGDVVFPQAMQESIVRRVLAHVGARTTDRVESTRRQATSAYTSPEVHRREVERLFRGLPVYAGHASAVADPGAFFTAADYGVPLLVNRSREGVLGAFLNVCRHRGARVALAAEGRSKCFVCPYHGWTYDTAGKLIHVPCEEGFPDLAPTERDLVPVPIEELFGGLWVRLDGAAAGAGGSSSGAPSAAEHLAPLAAELAALNLDRHVVYERVEETRRMNWKLVVEGFSRPTTSAGRTATRSTAWSTTTSRCTTPTGRTTGWSTRSARSSASPARTRPAGTSARWSASSTTCSRTR
jgi:nitrite reductase/ring-hydroxylating ferredoxin subunit